REWRLRPEEARSAASAAALTLIIAGNGAVIVWMWLHDGGISGVHGRPEAFTSLGRLTFGHEFSRLLGVYPGMVTATIGTAIMVLVVLTSIAIARRRMRYESWYF